MTPHFKELVDSMYILLKKTHSNIRKSNEEMVPYYKLYFSMVLVAIGDAFTYPAQILPMYIKKRKPSVLHAETYRKKEIGRRRREARQWLDDTGGDIFNALGAGSWDSLSCLMRDADTCIMSECNKAKKEDGPRAYFDTRKKMSSFLRRRVMRIEP